LNIKKKRKITKKIVYQQNLFINKMLLRNLFALLHIICILILNTKCFIFVEKFSFFLIKI